MVVLALALVAWVWVLVELAALVATAD